LQVEVGQRANEWLQGQELDEGTGLRQRIDTVDSRSSSTETPG
jgi:hypothetical protein